MTITVRFAELRDRDRCEELLNLLVGNTAASENIFSGQVFETIVVGRYGRVLLACEDELALGMASISFNYALRYDGRYAQLEELIVDPVARGKNVGGLLVEEALKAARDEGCKEFGLYLLESTKHNQPFYEKYGFGVIGHEMRQSL
tara:strand:- start:1361 stop:1798 length:438 start_codon:yes stop_codon:yes gene_type:complete